MAQIPVGIPDLSAPPQEVGPDAGPERHAVADGSRQAGNAASTSPGGGEMGIAPIADTNRNTNLDRAREQHRCAAPQSARQRVGEGGGAGQPAPPPDPETVENFESEGGADRDGPVVIT